jgi:hypothetical protein
MKRIIFVLVILFFSTNANCEQGEKWYEGLESHRFYPAAFKDKNYISEYLHYDFSTLFTPRSKFLGFIGKDYKRMRIFFISISKDTKVPSMYKIEGVSIVGNNKCNFNGNIKVIQIREFREMHFGVDDELKNEGFKSQGVVIGDYSFRENTSQKHSGTFHGKVIMYWYVDRFGMIHYDDIALSYSDNYTNNQYVGTWTDYKNGTHKIANWGEWRIPFSGDLDIGAGEFGVNPKYYEMDWEDFKDRY